MTQEVTGDDEDEEERSNKLVLNPDRDDDEDDEDDDSSPAAMAASEVTLQCEGEHGLFPVEDIEVGETITIDEARKRIGDRDPPEWVGPSDREYSGSFECGVQPSSAAERPQPALHWYSVEGDEETLEEVEHPHPRGMEPVLYEAEVEAEKIAAELDGHCAYCDDEYEHRLALEDTTQLGWHDVVELVMCGDFCASEDYLYVHHVPDGVEL